MNANDATDLAKNSRASRVIRVIRIIRLIRLIRIVKLYKQQQIAKDKALEYQRQAAEKAEVTKNKSNTQVHPSKLDNEYDSEESEFDFDILDDNDEDEAQFKIPEESKISRTLSDKTLKSVVMLVLLLLFILPVVTAETYITPAYLHE